MIELPELRDARATALALRTSRADPAADEAAARVLDAVARDGTAAVLRFTAQFDEVKLAPSELFVSRSVLEHARRIANPELLQEIRDACERAEKWGRAQRESLRPSVLDGATLRWIPRARAGVYVRRAHADVSALASRVGLARAAGVREVIFATAPTLRTSVPGAFGVDARVLACAAELGVESVFLAGGAQAIGELASRVGPDGALLGPFGRFSEAAARRLASHVALEPIDDAPDLALIDEAADWEAVARFLASERAVALALDAASADRLARTLDDRSAARVFRANRDRAVVFAQALRPRRALLQVADPQRWHGELTDCGAILRDLRDAALLAPPLMLFLRPQPVA